jgi:predicted MPP superfamily phosphohydrolase
MTPTRVVVALAILSTFSGLIHRYLWARLVRDPSWPAPWGAALTVALLVLAALVPATFVGLRVLARDRGAPLAWFVFTWMGIAFYLLLGSAVVDMVHVLGRASGAWPKDAERRIALARITAGLVSAAVAVVASFGVAHGLRTVAIKKVRVPLARLPKSASGYRIVQLTDIHVGPTIGRGLVESLVSQTNAIEPDMVVITGDLVDGSVEQLGMLVEPLRELRAKDGVYFVTGNHEYYSGADEWIAHLGKLGIRVLRNERVPVRDAFDLAGVDDTSAHRMLAHHGQDIEGALRGRDPLRTVVLLAHQPKAVHQAAALGVDLQLSGHVHGGQMVPFNWLVRLDQPFVSGLHRVGGTWVYVSMGAGYWGPPMRVGSTAEITCLELVAA